VKYDPKNPIHDDIPVRFEYHKPSPELVEDIEHLRSTLWIAAASLAHRTPECREQELAVTKIEEALYWAIAAIVRRSVTSGEVE
jgi:hypothetical protein